jgi:acetolactate synthase regulatory subunit
MQWLITLEIEHDPITTCRLMNIYRRKGVNIVTLAMAAQPQGLSMMAVVETPESEVDHIFNLLRRTEGVQHVTYYRHEPSQDAAFVFVDAGADSTSMARLLQSFPESKLIFASHGKYLLEVATRGHRRGFVRGFDEPGFLPFARIRTTQRVPAPALVAAPAT